MRRDIRAGTTSRIRTIPDRGWSVMTTTIPRTRRRQAGPGASAHKQRAGRLPESPRALEATARSSRAGPTPRTRTLTRWSCVHAPELKENFATVVLPEGPRARIGDSPCPRTPSVQARQGPQERSCQSQLAGQEPAAARIIAAAVRVGVHFEIADSAGPGGRASSRATRSPEYAWSAVARAAAGSNKVPTGGRARWIKGGTSSTRKCVRPAGTGDANKYAFHHRRP